MIGADWCSAPHAASPSEQLAHAFSLAVQAVYRHGAAATHWPAGEMLTASGLIEKIRQTAA